MEKVTITGTHKSPTKVIAGGMAVHVVRTWYPLLLSQGPGLIFGSGDLFGKYYLHPRKHYLNINTGYGGERQP